MKALLWFGLMAFITGLGYLALCIAAPSEALVRVQLELAEHPSVVRPALRTLAMGHPLVEGPVTMTPSSSGRGADTLRCNGIIGSPGATLSWWVEASEGKPSLLHQEFRQPINGLQRGLFGLEGPPKIPEFKLDDVHEAVTAFWGRGEVLPFAAVELEAVGLPGKAESMESPSPRSDTLHQWLMAPGYPAGDVWRSYRTVATEAEDDLGDGERLLLPLDTVRVWRDLADEKVAMHLAEFLSNSKPEGHAPWAKWAVRYRPVSETDTNATAPQWSAAALFGFSF